MKSEFIDSLSSCGDVEYDKASDLLLHCIHIKAVQSIIGFLDDEQGVSAEFDLSGNVHTMYNNVIANDVV